MCKVYTDSVEEYGKDAEYRENAGGSNYSRKFFFSTYTAEDHLRVLERKEKGLTGANVDFGNSGKRKKVIEL